MGWFKLEKGKGQAIIDKINALFIPEYLKNNPETIGIVTAYTQVIELDDFDYIIENEVTKQHVTNFIEILKTLPLPENIFLTNFEN